MLFSWGTLSWGIDPPKCRCLHVALGETLWPVSVPVHPPPLSFSPPLPFAFTPCLSVSLSPSLSLSLSPPRLSSQRSTSAEADVWLDAINKTIIWDGLPSRPAQSVGPSAMNHLDRGEPLRRQTLNISPVGFLRSIPVHVSAFFFPFYFFFFYFFPPFALYSRSSGLSVSQQQHSPDKGLKVLRFKVICGWMTVGKSQTETSASKVRCRTGSRSCLQEKYMETVAESLEGASTAHYQAAFCVCESAVLFLSYPWQVVWFL